MNLNKAFNDILTKETPFEDALQTITPMIHHIASQIDGVYGLEIEDVIQELSVQAYDAWEKWEPERGIKFSTYVYNVLLNKKNCLIRIAKAQKRNSGLPPVSLDEPIEGQSMCNSTFCLYDVLMDISQNLEDQTRTLEIWDIVERALASMQENGQNVIGALLMGYTQVEISRLTGATQPLVSYYLRSFRTKVKAELERIERG